MRYLFSKSFVLFAIGLWVLACSSQESKAETRRALLVGINIYQPGGSTVPASIPAKTIEEKAASSLSTTSKGRNACGNLDGPVNDVAAIREILIGKYGFKPENIHVLKDSEATREGILTALQKYLIDQVAPGDIGIFFFAGHGSQVINSKSPKPGRIDETIVPADSYQGAQDIRDKELARLFNKALDKGIILTAIFDSCHSGSIARGLPSYGKPRYCSLDTRDIADPPDPVPNPEERGALVFSAAQEYQPAMEVGGRGAFSLALLNTLQGAPNDETAEHIFLQVKALMQTEGKPQEPVLAGPADRRKKPLFGGESSGVSGRPTAAVLRVKEGAEVELQGGFAIGLSERCELRKVGGAPGDTSIRIQVTEVLGLSRCRAKVIKGNMKAIKPGDLFELDRWAAPSEANLRVWMPPALGYSELSQIAQEMATLRESDRIQWIDDPTKETPTHVMSWETSGWKLKRSTEEAVENLGKSPTAKMILARLDSEAPGKAKLFIHFPPPIELVKELQLGAGTVNSSIEVTSSPERAHYQLGGRVEGKEIEYAWVLPGVTGEDAEKRSLPLPVRTDWINVTGNSRPFQFLARKLEDYALRIGRVKAWLQINPPPDQGIFPYRLALKNTDTGHIRTTETTVFDKDSYGLILQADEAKLKAWIDKRFVYVFAIDNNGNSQLLFPQRDAGSVGNRVPYDSPGQEKYPPSEIRLGSAKLFVIGPPFGVDVYILLASEEPIPNPRVLVFEGVRTRGGSKAPGKDPETPLANLLQGVGSATRGTHPPAPTNWSIQRLMIKSAPKPE